MKLAVNKKVVFDDFTHSYLCGDKVLMGCTTLMKKHSLSPEYGSIPEDVLMAAAARGTAVHKCLEAYDNGEAVVFTDTIYKGELVLTADQLKDNLDAYKRLGLNIIASEYLVSDNKTVASSVDKVIDIGSDTEVDLGDVKTTSELHMKALSVQLGVHKYLFEKQNKKIKVRKCWGIHIRNGKEVYKEVTPWPAEKVEALLKAEANGELYTEEVTEAVAVMAEERLAAYVEAETMLADLKAKAKEIEDRQALIREEIYATMLEKNIDEMPYGNGKIVLKRSYTSNRVDSTKLQKNYPDAYKDCLKTSETKGSVSFKPHK